MDDFLIIFFPNVYERKKTVKENNYCKYDDQLLQLFTSSLYLAALVSSFFASKAATKLGRRITIMLAALIFIAGAILSAIANGKFVLILGRILFGVGVGFGNEVHHVHHNISTFCPFISVLLTLVCVNSLTM